MEYLYVPTEHQRAILETVRRFVEEEVIPRAASLDTEQDPAKCYSWEIVEKAHALGIRTMTLGEKWGGLGADPLTTAMVIEELSKGDLGVGVTLGQTMKLAQIFQSGLNEEQKDRVLPKFAEDSRGMLAIGITEPDNASNYLVPFPVPFRTVAVKAKGGWIVNGMKHFISNANRASFFLFFAQTEKDKSMTQGSTCFLVERGRPGFSIGRVHDKMGERLANNAEMIFDDCFIPDENVVGKVGDGFAELGKFMPWSNAYGGATILGAAVALHRKAVDWAKIRIQGGKPLIEHDGIRSQLAEMHMLIEASRSYIHRVCWLAVRPQYGWDKALGALPKVMAAKAAWQIATWCLEIHGGHGYMKEVGVEKLVRDAAAYLHSDGVNHTLLLKAANFMFAA